MTFVATDGADGPRLRRGLVWTLAEIGGETLINGMDIADLRMALAPGRYRVEVTRMDDEQTASRGVAIGEGDPRTVQLPLQT